MSARFMLSVWKLESLLSLRRVYLALAAKRFSTFITFSWLILCFWAGFCTAESLPQQIHFQHILENKDTNMGESTALFQDSEGYMWFGSRSALVRYDGYDLKQIDISSPTNPLEKTPVTYVESIFEDSHHRLWVGTKMGLLRYDANTEILSRVGVDGAFAEKISRSDITHLGELPTGEIIAAYLGGFFYVDPVTLVVTDFTAQLNNGNVLINDDVEGLFIDGDSIWFGTGVGIERLDWKTKTFSFYKINNENPDRMDEAKVFDLVPDGHGQFWVATRHGLVHYDPATHTEKRYLNDPLNPFSISSNDTFNLLMDSQGNLWVGTDGGGLSVYDKETDRFIRHTFEPGRPDSLSTNVIRSLYQDKNGDIWIGNYPAGINFFDKSSSSIVSYVSDITNPKSLSFTAVQSLAEDAAGNLWVGTDGGGLNYFRRDINEFTHFKSDRNDVHSISGDAVLSSAIDSSGVLWLGTWSGGISSYDPTTKKITRYPFDAEHEAPSVISQSPRLNSRAVWSVMEDSRHDIWIGTHFGGLSKYNRDTKIFTHYEHSERDPTSLSSNLVWTTYEDSRGNFWVGTVGGLNLMDRERGTFTAFLIDPKNPNAISGASILTVFEDSKKRLWVGTTSGLNLFHPETNSFSVFNKTNGFIDDNIRAIVEDLLGMLWISTNNGFASFDPETKKIKNYNRLSGRLMGDFKTHTGLLSRKGEVIFGGTNGLFIINPNALSENKFVPTIVLTDLKLFADSVVVGGAEGILKTSINRADSITLDYTQSMITFNFAALNFRDAAKNHYSYKLEGFDKNWIDVGTQRSAKYTNLDPGHYVFKVRGSNNDGVWNNTGKSIAIIQLPPPWRTGWAYTIYAIFAGMVVGLFVQSQRKKRVLVEAQNRLLEMKVAERTAELREKNNDIQAMLTNMRQGLFTIEAGGRIHPEYSHFLEEIFEVEDISGHNVLTLLFGNANLGGDLLNKMKTSISSIVDEHEMNFHFNAHLLIRDYEANFGGKLKSLSLDWNPVIVNSVVTKLMVSVRDVTQLKKMEAEARTKKRELEMISQLLAVPPKKYLNFSASTKRFIAENRAQLESNQWRSDAGMALLLRNLHTLKGNCRTFHLGYLSDLVHDVESVYSSLKTDEGILWDRGKMLQDLQRVETVFKEYERVYFHVLGRGAGMPEVNQAFGYWLDTTTVETIQRHLDDLVVQFPALKTAPSLQPIQSWIHQASSLSLQEVLSDILDSLPSIAAQVDKESPNVIMHAQGLRIALGSVELVTHIFSHIFRNAIDHGLELPAERVRLGKPAAGTIRVSAAAQGNQLVMRVSDDGRGLHLGRLFAKGVELQRWDSTDKPSYAEIADLIFVSGVSTTKKITDLSGRGVGMDAVRAFLQERSGQVFLRLLESGDQTYPIAEDKRMPFELIIELPSSAFVVVE